MILDNQRGVVTGMGAPTANGESARRDEVEAIKAGVTFSGPAIVADHQGGAIAAGATVNPDVMPVAGKQCFSYSVGSNCTIGALAGTASLAAGTAVGGAIFITFTGTATVTLAATYKPPVGVPNSFTGAAGEVWRIDFLYRRSADRCSASYMQETA